MQTYILKRVLLFIPTLLVVSLLVFFLMRIVPGDPALFMAHSSMAFSTRITEKQIEAKRKELGFIPNIVKTFSPGGLPVGLEAA